VKRIIGVRGVAALVGSSIALAAFGAGTAAAKVPNSNASTAGAIVKSGTTNAVVKNFSFIGTPSASSVGKTIVNLDGLLINARCNAAGAPIVYAFTTASGGDLLGHVFDGLGRTQLIRSTSFSKAAAPKGILVSTTSGDFDSSGILEFENINGQVVSITYAFDNSTTLNQRKVCTVYGSAIGS
jgi:hypothetical protein